MSIRNLLASLIRSRAAYERVGSLIPDSDLSEQEKLLLVHVQEYYERDPEAKCVDPELLTNAICRDLQNPKHKDQFASVVKTLVDMEVSPANVVQDFIEVRRTAAGNKLATALAASKKQDDVAPLLEEYAEWAARTDIDTVEKEVVQGKSVRDLIAPRIQAGGRDPSGA